METGYHACLHQWRSMSSFRMHSCNTTEHEHQNVQAVRHASHGHQEREYQAACVRKYLYESSLRHPKVYASSATSILETANEPMQIRGNDLNP